MSEGLSTGQITSMTAAHAAPGGKGSIAGQLFGGGQAFSALSAAFGTKVKMSICDLKEAITPAHTPTAGGGLKTDILNR